MSTSVFEVVRTHDADGRVLPGDQVLRDGRLLRPEELPAGLLQGLLNRVTRTVLFVCVQNAARSLMAEAIFNADPPPGWVASSAGTEPASGPNPRTARILGEVGLSPPGHPPQLLTPDLIDRSSVRITMGCLDRESCPARRKATELTDWSLPDPAVLDDEGFRKVRDEIRRRVGLLRRSLLSERADL